MGRKRRKVRNKQGHEKHKPEQNNKGGHNGNSAWSETLTIGKNAYLRDQEVERGW